MTYKLRINLPRLATRINDKSPEFANMRPVIYFNSYSMILECTIKGSQPEGFTMTLKLYNRVVTNIKLMELSPSRFRFGYLEFGCYK